MEADRANTDPANLDPDSEVVQAVAALNELRDVLNDVSLTLKDLKATQDFADHGSAWMQSSALLTDLFNSIDALRRGNASGTTGGVG